MKKLNKTLLAMFAFVLIITGKTVSAQEPELTTHPAEWFTTETYIVTPFDRLSILIYAREKLREKHEVTVKSDGSIYLPYLEKDSKIGGMTIREAEKYLEEESAANILYPRVTITLISSYSRYVYTYGRISSRTEELVLPTRILQLIARVGGPHEGAKTDSIRVISLDGTTRYFNYELVNKNPDSEDNFHVRPGDIIFVPAEDDISVTILGEVGRTGVIPMSGNSRVLDALVNAGAWRSEADIRNIRVIRTNSNNRTTVSKSNLSRMLKGGSTADNFLLEDGDIVYVPQRRISVFLRPTASALALIYSFISTVSLIYFLVS